MSNISRRSRRTAVTAVVLVGAVGLSACGSSNDNKDSKSSKPAVPSGQPGKGKPAVTIGSKNFTEQFILGELYAQALRAKGYKVTVKSNIGSSEITDKALTSGKIDGYPEYTGVICTELAKKSEQPRSEDAAYACAKDYEGGRGFTTLDKTPFFDADGLAVKPAYAQKNGLKDVADLKKVGSFSYGAPPENKTRYQGVLGMKKAYGLTKLQFKPLAIGLQYPALKTSKIDVAAVFTTDGQLQGGAYTVLKDSKGIFGFQNVTPVFSGKVLTAEGPAFTQTVNAVSAKLTNQAMQTMNAAVDLDKKKPAAVAKAFLGANGLG